MVIVLHPTENRYITGVVIAVFVPGGDFCLEGWEVSYAAIKALFGEGSQFHHTPYSAKSHALACDGIQDDQEVFWRFLAGKLCKGRLVCGCSDCQKPR